MSKRLATSLLAVAMLAGCKSSLNQFDETGGIYITRSACPAVAIPAYTGDVTVFSPPQSTDSRALDVVATITNLRSTCDSSGDPIRATATFEVQARRSGTSGAREVVLPYFATVVRGGTNIVSKEIGRVALRFEDGKDRASTTATATASVSKPAATLPDAVRQKLTRKRKASDADASVDPMADPATRAAVQSASFELLIGFQLDQAQLSYNATK